MDQNDHIHSIISDLNRLAESDGELWQFEAIARSITTLAEQRRIQLLSSNAALSYMERLFGESDAVKRTNLAEELRRGVLRQLHDIRWTLAATNDKDLAQIQPTGESLVQAYAMLNACAAKGKAIQEIEEAVLVQYEYEQNVCLKYTQLKYDHEYLIAQLVKSRLISQEDADHFLDILNNMTLPYESDLRPNWKGSMRSLVTFVVLGCELGVFKVDWKQKPQNPRSSHPRIENSPNFESAIINTFLRGNKEVYVGISRDFVKPIRASTPTCVRLIQSRHPKAVKQNGAAVDKDLIAIDVDNDDLLSDQFPDLDVEVIQIFDELLARSEL